MKTCSVCKVEKSLDAFPLANKSTGKLNSKCVPCKQKYDRDYWAKTKYKRRESKTRNSRNIRERNVQFIIDYFVANPCVACGAKDPLVLQFDHLDPKKKKHNISDMVKSSTSLSNLKSEIDKCRVLCANCHSRHTAQQRNYTMYQILTR